MNNDELRERVWSLHCRGNAISQIADKLNVPEWQVRVIICDKWADMEGA